MTTATTNETKVTIKEDKFRVIRDFEAVSLDKPETHLQRMYRDHYDQIWVVTYSGDHVQLDLSKKQQTIGNAIYIQD